VVLEGIDKERFAYDIYPSAVTSHSIFTSISAEVNLAKEKERMERIQIKITIMLLAIYYLRSKNLKIELKQE
jgi:hypothetical protein